MSLGEETLSSIHSSAPESMPGSASESAPVKTLAVDIGGSGVKVIVLDPVGQPLTERGRAKTPSPATPEAMLAAIADLTAQQGRFDRVSVGFPGVVRQGVVFTAVNLDSSWVNFDLGAALNHQLGCPVRVANDADMQGMGAVSGHGVELVVTLGTGFGSALFTDGRLVPNLEMAHHRFRKGETYEAQLGRAALEKVGLKRWSQRLLKAIAALEKLFNYDHLYIGGGEASKIQVDLPKQVTVVPNILGLLGGIALWRE